MSDLPRHVGLIPDGARRWARQNHCPYIESYALTMKGITRFVRFMFGQGVSSTSVYLLSKENLKRKPTDLEPIIVSEVDLLTKLLPPIVEQFGARVFHAGHGDLVPRHYAEAMSALCQRTLANTERRLYLLAAYNPLDELVAAFQRVGNPSIIFQHLWVPEALDLVIRTSGEYRISNFLPLQAGYAEFIFVQKHFNDLVEEDMEGFLDAYRERQRRLGI